jgi:predicted ATPase/class 3 adenylate cyclase
MPNMPGRQPSGTVTLVFTDVEGSTRLLLELGEDVYQVALAEHRRVVREAFSSFDGYEVDYQGDGFFYAFGSAQAAVDAVREAMERLEGGRIRIRVGIHTGEPAVDSPKYVGVDVHRAARIMSVGHGGQALLSKSTRELVQAETSDLGEHRLRDLDGSVWLYQLGNGRFPPLRSLNNIDLPIPASSFHGREQELEEGRALLASSRFLTITGPGGTGKTRFAIELAQRELERFPNGVFWIGLAPVRDSDLVLPTIVDALGAKGDLDEHVNDKTLLLLIDNLEHVIACAPALAALLETCPNLTLLVTSRELLRVRGETEYALAPLDAREGVELFCTRARTEPSDTVTELCKRLDNLPLALELAAARTRILTPDQLLQRLGQALDLLKGGRDSDERQQTLRATIQWSYDLLDGGEKTLLARLAIFAGGCTLDAAEEICDADLDTLQSLTEKSLIRQTEGRFWQLETIRDYATERLSDLPEAKALRERHAQHFLALAEEAERHFTVSTQGEWIARLVRDHDNLRIGLEHLLLDDQSSAALRMSHALARYWNARGSLDEGRLWLMRSLDVAAGAPAGLRADALTDAALLALDQGDYLSASVSADEAVVLAAQSGDALRGARALSVRGWLAAAIEDTGRALELCSRAVDLAEETNSGETRAFALNCFGEVMLASGDADQARRVFEDALRIRRNLGDTGNVLGVLGNLGLLALREGRLDEAVMRLTESLRLAFDLDDGAGIGIVLDLFADVVAACGDARSAACLWGAAASALEANQWQLPLNEQAEHDAAVAAARAVSEASDFDTSWAKGQAMTIDEAVEYADQLLASFNSLPRSATLAPSYRRRVPARGQSERR